METNVLALMRTKGAAVTEEKARTYYFTAETEAEMDEWAMAIHNNIQVCAYDGTLGKFRDYLKRVGASTTGYDLSEVLNQLYGYA